MPNIGKGVPPPANIRDVIRDLFQNEKSKNLDKTKFLLTCSKVKLDSEQQNSLAHPEGFKKINFYVLLQYDTIDKKRLVNTKIQLLSFLKKDGFIYGYYFNVSNQPRFPIGKLVDSHRSIRLSNSAIYSSDEYLEVYHNIHGTTIISAFSFNKNELYSSLQYSKNCKYYYQQLSAAGIVDPILPVTNLTGLSKNLENLFKKH